jgi:trimeric autotransporter adhesin
MSRKTMRITLVDAIIAVLLLHSHTAMTLLSQSFYGAIRGTLRDPGGHAVPGAKLILTDENTNLSRVTVTSAEGDYAFNQVVPSTYSVTAEMAGFKKFQRKGIVVATQEQIPLDLTLEIGDITQSVEVTADAAMIDAASASQGQVLNEQKLSEMPNIGRNPFILSKVAQNVIQVGNPVMNRMQDQSSTALTSVAGGMVWQNNFFIDGVPISDWQGRPIIIPSIEAVAEVKIQANTYDAEMGRTGGGVFNTILKSGTNTFHGVAYGAIRRTSLNANLFFNNAAGNPRGQSPNDNWAGNFGGPVFVPKIYNGRNRTFFFLALEVYNNSEPASVRSYVPTALERSGDFSQTRNADGSLRVIHDPLTTVQNSDGSYRRTPFPGNTIPSNRIDRVGRNIASYYPEPGSQPSFYGNLDLTSTGLAASRARQYVGKVDHQVFNWWRATLSYLRYYSIEPGSNYFGGPASPDQWALSRKVDATAFNNLFTISPNTVLAVRYGFNRFPNVFYTTSEIQGFDLAGLGFSPTFVSQAMGRAFPTISMTTASSLANSNHSWNNLINNSASALVSKNQGSHSIKAGFDFRRLRVIGYGYGDMAGSFAFNGVFTQSSPTNPTPGTGADVADLLLGHPASGSASLATKLTDYAHYYSFYVQDDVRLTPRLALNLGLRWERETGIREVEDRLYVNFDKDAINPLGANLSGITPRGVVQFAGADSNPRHVGDPNKNKFGPRVGVAFQVDEKTVLRGGYGLIWAPQSTIGSPLAPAGYSATTQFIATTNGFVTPAASLSDPFPNGLISPVGKSQGPLTGIGQGVSIFSPMARSPRIHQYSVDIQRELAGGIALQVGYVGSHGKHLAIDVNQNVLDPSFFSRGTALNQSVANPFFGRGGTGVIGTANVSAAQLLLPFPTFGAVVFSSSDLNHSRYDSLVIKGDKRLSSGLSLLSTLTWAKSYDLGSSGNVLMPGPSGIQNPFDLEAEYSRSSFNAPLVWSTVFSYELPVGRSKRFLHDSRLIDLILGQWQVNGVALYRSGFPLPITQNQNFNAGLGYPGQRPNATGISPETPGSLQERLNNYLNPSAFSQAPQFVFGNVSRFIGMRGPGQANWDLSLFKTVTIVERVRAQLRVEALNAFNTPLFNGPNTSFGSASFGQITSQGNQARAFQFCLRIMF